MYVPKPRVRVVSEESRGATVLSACGTARCARACACACTCACANIHVLSACGTARGQAAGEPLGVKKIQMGGWVLTAERACMCRGMRARSMARVHACSVYAGAEPVAEGEHAVGMEGEVASQTKSNHVTCHVTPCHATSRHVTSQGAMRMEGGEARAESSSYLVRSRRATGLLEL